MSYIAENKKTGREYKFGSKELRDKFCNEMGGTYIYSEKDKDPLGAARNVNIDKKLMVK